jgi:hypothetical protein
VSQAYGVPEPAVQPAVQPPGSGSRTQEGKSGLWDALWALMRSVQHSLLTGRDSAPVGVQSHQHQTSSATESSAASDGVGVGVRGSVGVTIGGAATGSSGGSAGDGGSSGGIDSNALRGDEGMQAVAAGVAARPTSTVTTPGCAPLQQREETARSEQETKQWREYLAGQDEAAGAAVTPSSLGGLQKDEAAWGSGALAAPPYPGEGACWWYLMCVRA